MKIMSSTSTDALRLPEIRISDLNILQACVLRTMFANTRFVWVEINNIGVMNTLLKRSAPSGIWYFPNKWYFSTGISIPIPSTVQIALCGRWYCYLVFVSGISKCKGMDNVEKSCVNYFNLLCDGTYTIVVGLDG